MAMFQLDMNATFKILKILEKSKLKSEEVFTKIPGVVMIISGEGRVLKGNSFLSEILGCYSDELHTKSLADILIEENYKLFFKNLETTTDTVGGKNFETKLTIAGDSSLKIYSWDVSFLTSFQDRSVDTYLAVGRDITDVRIIQEKLVDANKNLEEKVRQRTVDLENAMNELKNLQGTMVSNARMASLGEMAGNMAHEINNPLTIIKHSGKSIKKSLLKKKFSDERVEKFLVRIDQTVDRMAAIIANLKGFSRDASNDPHTTVTIQEIVEESVFLIREKMTSVGINLEVDIEKVKNEPLVCSKVPLTQVIVNILTNAYDFIKNLDNKWIKITVEKTDEVFIFSIIDSGEGIPFENRDRIFEPFFTTKELGDGQGLGLSIAVGIVEKQHNGSLEVDGDCENTKFVMKIPRDLEGAS
ncbi:MAG: hypothetical protein CME68_08075 [Halobacteriovoraceae bacterium]|nr:hypothetical protein [Halobacteriovoraceae bacterium]